MISKLADYETQLFVKQDTKKPYYNWNETK